MTQSRTWTPHGFGARPIRWLVMLALLLTALPACAVRAAVEDAAPEEGSTRYVVMLGPEARFYGRPDASGASVGLWMRSSPAHPWMGFPMERIETSEDGEWVRVRNLEESGQSACAWADMRRQLLTDYVAIDAWVRRESLVPHVTELTRVRYPDGTWLELQPGVRVEVTKSGEYWAIVGEPWDASPLRLPWSEAGVGLESVWRAREAQWISEETPGLELSAGMILAEQRIEYGAFWSSVPLCEASAFASETHGCAHLVGECYRLHGIAVQHNRYEPSRIRGGYCGVEFMDLRGNHLLGGPVSLPNGVTIGEWLEPTDDVLFRPIEIETGHVCGDLTGAFLQYEHLEHVGDSDCANCVCFEPGLVHVNPVWRIAEQLGVSLTSPSASIPLKIRWRQPTRRLRRLDVEQGQWSGRIDELLVAYLLRSLSWDALRAAGLHREAAILYKWHRSPYD